ncbi:hypothetical protein NFX39_03325 [Fructobacillus sp. W13]|uniref:Lipoprotein n=1 Tax=Fructobacillus apis TaxID=2935017 RepID=A0ABT0ZQ51_9LACO|nr:hypothetical protein [Fructobacillus apis]MCO0832119.1 hypothetical protein [Fructobacillus apis]
MSKKIILISSLVAIAVVAVIGGAYALGASNPSTNKQSKVEKTVSSATSKTKESTDSSSQDDQKVKTSAYSALPQKVQIALLTYGSLPTNYGTPLKTHYSVYMGDKDKIVVYDDGEGAGGFAEHTVMFTDNHNGTFTESDLDTSAAPDMAGVSPQNSFWKSYKTITEDDMMKNYNDHKDEINFSANELVDLSKSGDKFSLIPTNQTKLP